MRIRFAATLILIVALAGCASDDPESGDEASVGSSHSATKIMPNEFDGSQFTLNEYEWNNASEILIEARKLIERDGWQQGATEPIEAWCVSTALEGAWLQGPWSIVDFNYARSALAQTIGVPYEPEASDEPGSPDVPYWGIDFVDWNDDPARTEEEVLQAFTDAAALSTDLSAEAAEE